MLDLRKTLVSATLSAALVASWAGIAPAGAARADSVTVADDETVAVSTAADEDVKVSVAKVKAKVTKRSKTGLKVKLTCKDDVDGYQLRIKHKGAKKWIVKSAKSTKLSIEKLLRNRTYLMQFRAYKKASGEKHYGSWSKTVKAKTTKK